MALSRGPGYNERVVRKGHSGSRRVMEGLKGTGVGRAMVGGGGLYLR